ncbi:hypothetical protein ABZ901_26260, partial [Actinacidiphila alni]
MSDQSSYRHIVSTRASVRVAVAVARAAATLAALGAAVLLPAAVAPTASAADGGTAAGPLGGQHRLVPAVAALGEPGADDLLGAALVLAPA